MKFNPKGEHVFTFLPGEKCLLCHKYHMCNILNDLRMWGESSKYNEVDMSKCEKFTPVGRILDMSEDIEETYKKKEVRSNKKYEIPYNKSMKKNITEEYYIRNEDDE